MGPVPALRKKNLFFDDTSRHSSGYDFCLFEVQHQSTLKTSYLQNEKLAKPTTTDHTDHHGRGEMVSMTGFASLVSFSFVRWRNRLHGIAPHHVGDFRALNQIHLPFGISLTSVAISELQPVEDMPDPLSVAHLILVVS